MFHCVAALLIVVRYNSSAAIKHARNLPRHMHQVHGYRKDHFLGVSIYPSLFIHSGPLFRVKETADTRREGGVLRDKEEMMQSAGIPVAQTIHM